MGTAFERLGRILGAALVNARESFGHEATSDPFNGLYITPVHAQRCWEGATAGVVIRVDRADIRPGWADICQCDPRWEWLRATYHLSEFELDLVLVALATEVDLRY